MMISKNMQQGHISCRNYILVYYPEDDLWKRELAPEIYSSQIGFDRSSGLPMGPKYTSNSKWVEDPDSKELVSLVKWISENPAVLIPCIDDILD